VLAATMQTTRQFEKPILIAISLSISIGLVALTSCRNKIDLEYLKSSSWVWERGFKIGDGDFVDFDSDFYTVSHDTLFRKGIARCVIVKTSKDRNMMKVKSLTGDIGYYYDYNE
jgi:hypothetical protein